MRDALPCFGVAMGQRATRQRGLALPDVDLSRSACDGVRLEHLVAGSSAAQGIAMRFRVFGGSHCD